MKEPCIAAIVQARMTSTRLPGKVMEKINEKTVLERVLLRCKQSRFLDKIIVASPKSVESLPIKDLVSRCDSVHYIEGDEDDVLKRYWEAASKFEIDVVVRITSDCPLVDPGILDMMLNNFLILNMLESKKIDYYSNTIERTFPRGLDIEIFTIEALKRSHENAFLSEDREHVTRYIYTNPSEFNIFQYKSDFDASNYRLTLDTQEDLDMFQELFKYLKHSNDSYLWNVISVLKQYPHIARLNSHIEQKKF